MAGTWQFDFYWNNRYTFYSKFTIYRDCVTRWIFFNDLQSWISTFYALQKFFVLSAKEIKCQVFTFFFENTY
jgi:hypothetical protein